MSLLPDHPPSHDDAGRPGALASRLGRLVRSLFPGLPFETSPHTASGAAHTAAVSLVGGLSALVILLHFGGLQYRIYVRYEWYDLLTHGLSGFCLAAIYGLLWPSPRRSLRRWLLLVPLLVLVGAGFEVYEYLFKDFWYTWSGEYYATDTAIDLVADGAGAALLVACVGVVRWRWRWREQ